MDMPRLNWFKVLWLTPTEREDYRKLCHIEGDLDCLIQTLPEMHRMRDSTQTIMNRYDYAHDIWECAAILRHKIQTQINKLNN